MDSFIAHFHCRTRTQIPVLCRYYGKEIRIWIWVSGNMFCIILCSHRVWNPSLSPGVEMSHYINCQQHVCDITRSPWTKNPGSASVKSFLNVCCRTLSCLWALEMIKALDCLYCRVQRISSLTFLPSKASFIYWCESESENNFFFDFCGFRM